MPININANVNKLNRDIQAQINVLDQDIEVGIPSSIIYAFSPTAKVQLLDDNRTYRVTITDKNGTTTADIPIVTEENVDQVISEYFQQNPIVQRYVNEHNISAQAHEDIRSLIQNAVDSIPMKVSDLQNDAGYVTNFKEMIVKYNTFYDFPNVPSEQEKDMIFLDKSTGDMYLFGINDSLTYTSIGISSQDYIYGGDSSTQ